jgi:hypothetical protein
MTLGSRGQLWHDLGGLDGLQCGLITYSLGIHSGRLEGFRLLLARADSSLKVKQCD